MRPITLASGFTLGDYTSLLATRQLVPRDMYTLKLLSGTVLAYTNDQFNVTTNPCDDPISLRDYIANDVLISGVKMRVTSGQATSPGDPSVSIEVDEQTMSLKPNNNPAQPSLIDGTPFIEACQQGALDAAVFERDRWFLTKLGGVPVAGMPMFWGYVGALDGLNASEVKHKVKATTVLLNIQMPRNLYQPNCQYTVYDVNCGVNPASFVNHSAVSAGTPTRVVIPWTGAASQFNGGKVFWENGANINTWSTIKSVVPGVSFTLAYPVKTAPLVGDLFAAYPGCDRTYNGGCAFFSNQARFRGFEFTPVSEMAI